MASLHTLKVYDIHAPMMTRTELLQHLDGLGLTQVGAAKLLSVGPRTFRRWVSVPSELPGPAEQALRAWLRLNRLGIPWRPDTVPLGGIDAERLADQIASHRRHALDLDAVIRRVRARGGPAAPWKVDLRRRVAKLGPMSVHFYPLTVIAGGFSPYSYNRSDRHPDIAVDRPLLEDAYVCIADAIATAGPIWASDNGGPV